MQAIALTSGAEVVDGGAEVFGGEGADDFGVAGAGEDDEADGSGGEFFVAGEFFHDGVAARNLLSAGGH